jgi:hypothetical protein
MHQVVEGLHQGPDALAWGTYDDAVDTTGWGFLEIFTPPAEGTEGTEPLYYAAGYLEAYFTHTRMFQVTLHMHP